MSTKRSLAGWLGSQDDSLAHDDEDLLLLQCSAAGTNPATCPFGVRILDTSAPLSDARIGGKDAEERTIQDMLDYLIVEIEKEAAGDAVGRAQLADAAAPAASELVDNRAVAGSRARMGGETAVSQDRHAVPEPGDADEARADGVQATSPQMVSPSTARQAAAAELLRGYSDALLMVRASTDPSAGTANEMADVSEGTAATTSSE